MKSWGIDDRMKHDLIEGKDFSVSIRVCFVEALLVLHPDLRSRQSVALGLLICGAFDLFERTFKPMIKNKCVFFFPQAQSTFESVLH